MRGTKSITHGSSTDPRITPACAGNRPFMYVAGYGMKDHPPRVRGTGCRWEKRRAVSGITPACAGNSALVFAHSAMVQDHPRVCGEQPNYPLAPNPVKGSPPRVRGTGAATLTMTGAKGITPACAGNSGWGWRKGRLEGDHPRVCGEQNALLSLYRNWWGSPPRVRGTAGFASLA